MLLFVKGNLSKLIKDGYRFSSRTYWAREYFFNGAILGMQRQEIKRKLDEIVSFAEIGKFLEANSGIN